MSYCMETWCHSACVAARVVVPAGTVTAYRTDKAPCPGVWALLNQCLLVTRASSWLARKFLIGLVGPGGCQKTDWDFCMCVILHFCIIQVFLTHPMPSASFLCFVLWHLTLDRQAWWMEGFQEASLSEPLLSFPARLLRCRVSQQPARVKVSWFQPDAVSLHHAACLSCSAWTSAFQPHSLTAVCSQTPMALGNTSV